VACAHRWATSCTMCQQVTWAAAASANASRSTPAAQSCTMAASPLCATGAAPLLLPPADPLFHIVAVLSDNTEAHGEHPFSTCLFLGIIPSLRPSPPVRFRGSTPGKSRAVVHILQGTAGSDPAIPFVGRGHDGLVQAFVCCLVRCALVGCLPHLRYRSCYGRATNTCESSNAGSIFFFSFVQIRHIYFVCSFAQVNPPLCPPCDVPSECGFERLVFLKMLASKDKNSIKSQKNSTTATVSPFVCG
jgi:hypothetical protein